MNAEVALGDGYFKFLNVLFDAQGNSPGKTSSRLQRSAPTPLQTIQKLTCNPSNGGTLEGAFVISAGDDVCIVASRLELLQGAYIDSGAGCHNVLEIDAGSAPVPSQLNCCASGSPRQRPANWYTTTTGDNVSR
jgi:hypothetical protein